MNAKAVRQLERKAALHFFNPSFHAVQAVAVRVAAGILLAAVILDGNGKSGCCAMQCHLAEVCVGVFDDIDKRFPELLFGLHRLVSGGTVARIFRERGRKS